MEDVEEEADDIELFKVEKIVDCKIDKNGVPLYKTRWKGYSAADDTYEPSENVASTGHIDRFERKKRQESLRKTDNGVAVIAYEDGEREMIDLQMEKFRGYHPDSSDDERDDDTVDGDDDVNDFGLIAEGMWIEILWPHTSIYFPCKIISWTPIEVKKSKRKRRKQIFEDGEESSVSTSVQGKQKESKLSSKKRLKRADDARKSSTKRIFEDEEESSANSVQNKQKEMKRSSKRRSKKGNDATRKKQAGMSAPVSNSEPDLAHGEPTQQMFWGDSNKSARKLTDPDDFDVQSINSDSSEDNCDRPVERTGHGIPLFDEPEDDFDLSSDDDDNSDDEEEGDAMNAYNQNPNHRERSKMSFEEMWTEKLKQTQEMIGRGDNGLY